MRPTGVASELLLSDGDAPRQRHRRERHERWKGSGLGDGHRRGGEIVRRGQARAGVLSRRGLRPANGSQPDDPAEVPGRRAPEGLRGQQQGRGEAGKEGGQAVAGRGGEGSVREVRDERRFPVVAVLGHTERARRRGEVVRRVFTKAGLPTYHQLRSRVGVRVDPVRVGVHGLQHGQRVHRVAGHVRDSDVAPGVHLHIQAGVPHRLPREHTGALHIHRARHRRRRRLRVLRRFQAERAGAARQG
mmetsp:Transcript_7261/g.30063  ORF Transcript_7261/g.30063 Transcript_7261/m.30063 type:complete len:245 (-) Transcript_7261:2015-2749(-)